MNANGSLDIETILLPFPGENPAGADLKHSGPYDLIREARRSEVSIEPEGVREIKAADWNQVYRLAVEALSGKTKDLQIAAWLSEALVKLRQFQGLKEALQLLCGFHEVFWDCFYPLPDEDDLEARANLMTWVSRQTSLAIKEIKLTALPSGDNYNFLQWEESKQFDIPEKPEALGAEELYKVNQLREQAVQEKKIHGEQWRAAKNRSPLHFYEGLYEAIRQCEEEFHKLDGWMDQRFGRQTPGLGELKKALEEIDSLVERIKKEKQPAGSAPIVNQGPVPTTGSEPPVGPRPQVHFSGEIASRGEALRRLAEIAEFFRATEPHSPVSYLVQRAVHWGQMPLAQWLEDVIKDSAVLSSLRETLGIKDVDSNS